METVERFIEICEELGWSVECVGADEYIIAKRSPENQDFWKELEGSTYAALLLDLVLQHSTYDVSYETYLWLDDTGHGRSGAPYEMREVLDDMQACKDMIKELINKLQDEQHSSNK